MSELIKTLEPDGYYVFYVAHPDAILGRIYLGIASNPPTFADLFPPWVVTPSTMDTCAPLFPQLYLTSMEDVETFFQQFANLYILWFNNRLNEQAWENHLRENSL